MEVLKKYDELTIKDNFLFYHIMEKYPELCKEIIELAIGRQIGEIKVRAQQNVKETLTSKGIIIDIRVEGQKSWYCVEMQNIKYDSISKRARYYHSSTDMACLDRGASYLDLKDNYVIFICDFDIYNRGIPVYTVQQNFEQCRDLTYENGQHTIFLNTRYKDPCGCDERMLDFLDYLRENSPSGELAKRIEEAVAEAKYNDEWRQSYMDYKQLQILWRTEGLEAGREEGRKEGRKEGREEGREEGRKEGEDNKSVQIVRKMLECGETEEKISEYTGVSLEKIKGLQEQLKSK